uniref:VPS13 domain-containing protein n=1 Tax=Macrostomum lignano TaxID=282301 RepID=A0A1I8FQJ4_9PLAT
RFCEICEQEDTVLTRRLNYQPIVIAVLSLHRLVLLAGAVLGDMPDFQQPLPSAVARVSDWGLESMIMLLAAIRLKPKPAAVVGRVRADRRLSPLPAELDACRRMVEQRWRICLCAHLRADVPYGDHSVVAGRVRHRYSPLISLKLFVLKHGDVLGEAASNDAMLQHQNLRDLSGHTWTITVELVVHVPVPVPNLKAIHCHSSNKTAVASMPAALHCLEAGLARLAVTALVLVLLKVIRHSQQNERHSSRRSSARRKLRAAPDKVGAVLQSARPGDALQPGPVSLRRVLALRSKRYRKVWNVSTLRASQKLRSLPNKSTISETAKREQMKKNIWQEFVAKCFEQLSAAVFSRQ